LATSSPPPAVYAPADPEVLPLSAPARGVEHLCVEADHHGRGHAAVHDPDDTDGDRSLPDTRVRAWTLRSAPFVGSPFTLRRGQAGDGMSVVRNIRHELDDVNPLVQ